MNDGDLGKCVISEGSIKLLAFLICIQDCICVELPLNFKKVCDPREILKYTLNCINHNGGEVLDAI